MITAPDLLLADPLFKKGYAHGFAGEEPLYDRGWMPEEHLAYERGRHFATWCQVQGEGHVPLARGYLPHPRAITLLLRAIHVGDVL